MLLAIDFDATLFDVHTPWLRTYNKVTGADVQVRDIKNWDFSPAIPPENINVLWSLRTAELYLYDVHPMFWSRYVVSRLADEGLPIVVCTTEGNNEIRRAKYDLVQRYFPDIDRVLFAKDKHACLDPFGDYILIDDACHNQPDILYKQPWSNAEQGEFRYSVSSWEEVEAIVELIIEGDT